MLTTKTGQAVKEAVATDLSPNAVDNTGRVLSHEASVLFDKSIIARPLSTPEVCSLHVKHTEYMYRWVNYHAKGGLMYVKRRSQGFTDATIEDVDLLSGDAISDGGKITAFDLVLMKIPADRYDSAIKANTLEALNRMRTRGVYLDGASPDVFDDGKVKRVSVSQEPFARQAAPFIPANGDALVEDSIKSGRVEETRRVTEELRAAGKAAKEK